MKNKASTIKKTVYIFGNPDLAIDSLPIRLLPQLQKENPDFTFILKDPNEEWDVPEEMLIIDTAINAKKVTIFKDLKSFMTGPRLSMHDFDALSNLLFLEKLGRLKKIKIIAVPPDIDPHTALREISARLRLAVKKRGK
jgi:hypothetical protein